MKTNTLLLTAFLLINTTFTSTMNLNQQSKSELTKIIRQLFFYFLRISLIISGLINQP